MPKGTKSAKGDILIPVMGATGSGKSTFINTLLREPMMLVGKDLKSCTTELGFGYMDTIKGHPALKNHRIVLIDTPGFDDTYEANFTILEKIATGLKGRYKKGAKLGGVIYLHDISASRFSGRGPQELQTFRSLCGTGALGNVVLATTKWGLKIPDSELRHSELETGHWKPLIDDGAKVHRLNNSYESAWELIDAIVSTPILQRIDPKTTFDGKNAFNNSTSRGFSIKIALRPFSRLFGRGGTSL